MSSELPLISFIRSASELQPTQNEIKNVFNITVLFI